MRGQFTFYASFYEAMKNLRAADRLALYDAIAAYALTDAEPELRGSAAAMFALIRPTLDSSRRKAENGRNRREAKQEQTGSKPEANEEQTESKPEAKQKQTGSKPKANRKQTANEKEKELEKEIENEIEIEPEKENECSPSEGGVGGDSATGKSSRKSRKPHGEYGWVKLTDDEYIRLQREMTETELARCIAYLDELAQSNNNRAGWTDWNLVIRRCAREGWGRKQGASGKGAQPPAGDMKQPVRMEMGEYERAAMAKMAKGGGAG